MKVISPSGNLGGFTVLGKTPEGTCPECAVAHAPEQPHNRDSLAYQYKFRERMGSWPTWADAMAHCSDSVAIVWREELTRMGVDVGTVTPDLTKALSIRQPWAWLIVHGHKDVENRTRRTHYRGRILVHASKGMTQDEYNRAFVISAERGIDLPLPADLERGGIVGEVEIIDCLPVGFVRGSPWAFGPFCYGLANAKPLPFQPCKGMLGFFTPKLPTP